MPREFNWHIKRPQYGSRRLALKNHVVAAVGEVRSPIRSLRAKASAPDRSASRRSVCRNDAFHAVRPRRYQVRQATFPFASRSSRTDTRYAASPTFPPLQSPTARLRVTPAQPFKLPTPVTVRRHSPRSPSTHMLIPTYHQCSPLCVQSPGSTRSIRCADADVAVADIAFAFGFSLTVTAWCFARISGGLFNPAITSAYIRALFERSDGRVEASLLRR
jgi:hypothetical protein